MSTATFGHAEPDPAHPAIEQNGFCKDGFFPADVLRDTKPRTEIWGSYCRDEDRSTGTRGTASFPAPSKLQLFLAGYPGASGVSLRLERLRDRSALVIKPSEAPHEGWRLYTFSVPVSWQGKQVRLVGEDRSTAPSGWFAFSLVHPGDVRPKYLDALSVTGKTLLSFLLIALPCLAGACLAVKKSCRNLVVVGLVAMAALGATSYLSFWFWFKLRGLGRVENWSVAVGCASYILTAFATTDAGGRALLRKLCVPLGLLGAASLFVVFFGFLYGGVDDPFYTSATRFSAELPSDNRIPYLFAEWVVHRHERPPRFVDWQSSDRPPLQTGLYVSQFAFLSGQLGYEVSSVVAQCLWVFALWLLLTALDLDRHVIALSLAVCLASGFVLQNSFYTWPKMLAAAYMIGFAALLLSREFSVLNRGRWPQACLAGALLAFGMLSHGASMFAALGLGAILLLRRQPIHWRNAAVTAATAFLVYLPWMAYQKFYDPPGDRLLKLHLAGVYNLDPRPLGELVRSAYGAITPGQWLDGRIRNAGEIFDHQAEYWGNSFRLVQGLAGHGPIGSLPMWSIAADVRLASFFHLLPCLSVLMFGPLALLLGILQGTTRSPEWRAGAQMWLFVMLTSLFWCLVMFVPGATVLHQGTYVMVLFAMAGSVLAFWSAAPRAAYVMCGIFFLANLLPYVVFFQPTASAGYLQQEDLSYPFLWGVLLSLVLIAYLFHLMVREEANQSTARTPGENTNAGEPEPTGVAEQK